MPLGQGHLLLPARGDGGGNRQAIELEIAQGFLPRQDRHAPLPGHDDVGHRCNRRRGRDSRGGA
jgi:hypothetical protein